MKKNNNPRVLGVEEVIWKYMDDWKFFRMLEAFKDHKQWNGDSSKQYIKRIGQIWFSYPHSFGDTREGTFPAINLDPDQYCENIISKRGYDREKAEDFKRKFFSEDTQTLRTGIDFMAQISGVSCWHINDKESARMWEGFTSNKNSIALKTTVGELNNAIKKNYSGIKFKDMNCFSCAVGYIDYEKDFLEFDGYYGLLSVVDKEHSDEKEARFIMDSFRGREVRRSMKRSVSVDETRELVEQRKREQRKIVSELAESKFQEMRSNEEEGFYYPINLSELEFEVIINANCENGYFDEVTGMINSLGLKNVSVVRSSE